MADANDNAVVATLVIDGVKDEIRVVRFDGDEGLSRLFRFSVVLACKSATLDLNKSTGMPALLTITRDVDTVRYVHAMVAAFEQLDSGDTHTFYRVVLVPRAHRLLYRRDCRIFQDKSIKTIVAAVLDAADVDHKFHARAQKDPPKLDYCVQYRESDWNFVCRLLEDAGYYFFFEHKSDNHVMHIANDYQFHLDIAGDKEVPYHRPNTGIPGEEHVFRLRVLSSVRAGKVTLTDYNFERPSLGLRKDQAAAEETDLELYDYPGIYDAPEDGTALAALRLEASRTDAELWTGESDCVRLTAGYEVDLTGHPRIKSSERTFVLTEVRHQGDKVEAGEWSGALDQRVAYSNQLCCIPRLTPFRPPRLARRPVVQGVQTATVVGPSSEEIYTDKYGRVKLHFHWDRQGKSNENDSCWVRVSQLWAGQGWGAMWIPRVGQEVVVSFLEGNPDRPIVVGRVYNGLNVPPYVLPGHKTMSTIRSRSTPGGGGQNEIRFEDKKGAEEVYRHAQKDENIVVENDLTSLVKRDATETVGRDYTETVKRDYRQTVENTKRIDVTKSHTETVGTTMEITVGKSLKEEVGTECVQEVKGEKSTHVHKACTMVIDGKYDVQIGKAQSLEVTKDSTEVVHGKRDTRVGRDHEEQVQGDHKEDVTGAKELSAKTIHITAKDKLVISVGQAKIVVTKDGKISVTGTDMKHKGSSMNMSMSGTITLKGSKIQEN